MSFATAFASRRSRAAALGLSIAETAHLALVKPRLWLRTIISVSQRLTAQPGRPLDFGSLNRFRAAASTEAQ